MAAKKKATTKKKTTTKSTSKKSKTKAKSSSKSKSKKPAFGGYAINFAGRQETVEQVFGNKPIAPSEMTKKIWHLLKQKAFLIVRHKIVNE